MWGLFAANPGKMIPFSRHTRLPAQCRYLQVLEGSGLAALWELAGYLSWFKGPHELTEWG